MAAVVKQMAQMTMFDRIRALSGLGRAAATNPTALLSPPKVGTGSGSPPRRRETSQATREGRAQASARGAESTRIVRRIDEAGRLSEELSEIVGRPS